MIVQNCPLFVTTGSLSIITHLLIILITCCAPHIIMHYGAFHSLKLPQWCESTVKFAIGFLNCCFWWSFNKLLPSFNRLVRTLSLYKALSTYLLCLIHNVYFTFQLCVILLACWPSSSVHLCLHRSILVCWVKVLVFAALHYVQFVKYIFPRNRTTSN